MESEPQTGRWSVRPTDTGIDAECRTHDTNVARAGIGLWVGAEPTFTLRGSEAPEWLSEALGGDKQGYALRLMAALTQRHPGSVVLRTVGRQYDRELVPRWSVGLLEKRDGGNVWTGPTDPLAEPVNSATPEQLNDLWQKLQRRFADLGWSCELFSVPEALDRRLLVCPDAAIGPIATDDERVARPSVHAQKTPHEGLADPLASEGLFLIAIGALELVPGIDTACVELPAFGKVADFLPLLAAVGEVAREVGLREMVLQGFAPPIDETLAWTTVTPDPAVIEINQAPQPDVAGFLASMRELFEVAQSQGLSPYRLQYNGVVSDSGGGGQCTLGGRSATESPFLSAPTLLPRLVRYFNHHPALSYLFAPDSIGPASQSPRPDEGIRDAFRELAVAMEQLASEPQPDAAFLWASLAPFLADVSGNVHRSELNIEKLWNPNLPDRGCLGLVEFRAFRMPHSPERAAAIAALIRAIVAMLAGADPTPRLRDWGDALHDQYALPFFLKQDLCAVLDDLAVHDLHLGEDLRSELLHDPCRSRWQAVHGGCELALESAIEFWPLVGDVASQEADGSRLVDSSTMRLQVSLRMLDAEGPALDGWTLQIGGYELPLCDAQDKQGKVRLVGLRYRDFAPWRGLHPRIRPYGPLAFTLDHPALDEAMQATLHGWSPDGMAYSGLPTDLDVAAVRRAERLVIGRVPRPDVRSAKTPPPESVAGYTFDLRRLPTEYD